MRFRNRAIVVIVCAVGVTFLRAQTDKQEPPAKKTELSVAAYKIDPAKEADIRRLMEIAGTKALMIQMLDQGEKNVRPLLTTSLPPGEYRAKLIDLFFERYRSKMDLERLLDIAVISYDKYLNHEEIKALMQFYETPAGKKVLLVIPRLMTELMQEGQKIGEEAGRTSMLEVLNEHPELKEQMEAAAKARQR